MKVALFIVDPANDFCIETEKIRVPVDQLGVGHKFGPVTNGYVEVPTGNHGSLVVPGGEKDMANIATMVDRVGDRLDDIFVTMDSHQGVGIERPRLWMRCSDGAEPAPFTILDIHPDGRRIVRCTADASGLHPTEEEYTSRIPSMLHKGGVTGEGMFGYLRALKARGRHAHVIWPVHCRVGSWGWSVVPVLDAALLRWELGQIARVTYVPKGNNPGAEHFGGDEAEVPDPKDPTTQMNTGLVQALETADIIGWCGEARSHCVASTIRGISNAFSDPKYVEKSVLLTDATSDVPGFEYLGDAFVKEMVAKGMKLSTTTEFLA